MSRVVITIENAGTGNETVSVDGDYERMPEAIAAALNPIPVKATPAQQAKNTRHQYWRTFTMSPQDREKARVLAASSDEKAETMRYSTPGEAGALYRKAVNTMLREKGGE